MAGVERPSLRPAPVTLPSWRSASRETRRFRSAGSTACNLPPSRLHGSRGGAQACAAARERDCGERCGQPRRVGTGPPSARAHRGGRLVRARWGCRGRRRGGRCRWGGQGGRRRGARRRGRRRARGWRGGVRAAAGLLAARTRAAVGVGRAGPERLGALVGPADGASRAGTHAVRGARAYAEPAWRLLALPRLRRRTWPAVDGTEGLTWAALFALAAAGRCAVAARPSASTEGACWAVERRGRERVGLGRRERQSDHDRQDTDSQ